MALLSGCTTVVTKMSSGGEEESSKTTFKDLEPTIEARQFFNDPNCVVWNEGFPLSELKQLCEDLYRAGSPKVMFGGADELEGKKVSAWFVAELPKDKATRERVIKVWNEEFKDSDFEVKPDEDIDYLELALD
jgi:hypothetical protein